MTPFMALYGKEASSFTTMVREQSINLEVEEELLWRQEILDLVKINMEKAQVRMKKYADQYRSDV